MTYKVNDIIRIVVEDNCGYGKGHIGTITNITGWCYEVDGHYEYAESEIELVNNNVTQWEFPRLQVKLKPLTKSAVVPTYATVGSACFDLHADEDVIVHPGKTVAISTGLSFELPVGYQMKVLPRSGISLRTPLRVIIGTIDVDFRGEVKVILWNTSEYADRYDHMGTYSVDNVLLTEQPVISKISKAYLIRKGDRIAQAEVIPVTQVDFVTVDELSTTERGTGGFGSTGLSKDVPVENKGGNA